MKFFKSFLLFVLVAMFVSCSTPVKQPYEELSTLSVDSVLIIFLLENNIDTIQNTAKLLYKDSVLYNFKESIQYKVSVPDAPLRIEWETKHIPGSDNHPYVYWLELDGTGSADTSIAKVVLPVDQNRYRIRGTKLIEEF